MFADFNGLPDAEAATEFYQHDQHWSNRMISGDSLSVMASLAEREGLRGQVQCIYFDPPYGIKFNSNFQWSTTSRDVKDGDKTHVTREPEQVRAFRDTWKDGIHSYLTYLRDRLTVARDLLSDSGSIFVQIGDENVHRVRALMDEVFGEENFGHRTLHPDDHRPRRSGARSHLRLWHHGLCRRTMGAALDHHRHQPRRHGPRPLPPDGRALSLLPAGRQPEGQQKEGEITRTPPKSTPPTAASARASSTTACRTSR
jgi:hypothetical protein